MENWELCGPPIEVGLRWALIGYVSDEVVMLEEKEAELEFSMNNTVRRNDSVAFGKVESGDDQEGWCVCLGGVCVCVSECVVV